MFRQNKKEGFRRCTVDDRILKIRIIPVFFKTRVFFNILFDINFNYVIIKLTDKLEFAKGDDMLKYRYICSNKKMILYKVEQNMMQDFPVKSIWGINLYEAGIHFQECGETVKGFYLREREYESSSGPPLRVCFKGQFVYKKEKLCFDVFIYPRIIEIMFLIVAFFSIAFLHPINFIVGVIVLSIALKEYYDGIKELRNVLNTIFY